MRYVGCHILLQYSQIRYFQSSQTCYKTSHGGKTPSLLGLIMVFKWIKWWAPGNAQWEIHTMQTHIHKIKHGLKLEAESADVQQQQAGGGGGGGGERYQSQQEAICNRMSALVNLGLQLHMHMQAHTDKHISGGVCARVVVAPASGSSLMHVDCTLEPLGMEPSGSVCPVQQPAFAEVPGTTPIPASRGWQLKWTHQFNSLLLTHQTADGLINIWSFWSQWTWLHI